MYRFKLQQRSFYNQQGLSVSVEFRNKNAQKMQTVSEKSIHLGMGN